MPEQDGTQSPLPGSGGPPGPNPPAPGATPGPASQTPSGTPPSTPPSTPAVSPWTSLGYQSWDDLAQSHQRYKQQVSGSEQQANRLRTEADQARQALSQREEQFQVILAALGGKTPDAPGPVTSKQAWDAYLNGDEQTVSRYDAQLRQSTITPEAIQGHVVTALQTALKPAQYVEVVTRNHPELNNTQDPLFQAVWNQYDVTANDPAIALKYAPDPAAVRSYTGPDGVTRQIDLRVVDDLAWRLKATMAREQGRQDELNRQRQPNLPGPGGIPPPNNDDDTPLLTGDERRFVQDYLKTFPPEWGSTPEAVMKHKWTKLMRPEEKARRKAEHAAGRVI